MGRLDLSCPHCSCDMKLFILAYLAGRASCCTPQFFQGFFGGISGGGSGGTTSTSSTSYENLDAVVSGWGTLSSGGSTSSVLREVIVRTMSNSQCTRNTAYGSGDITSRMLCASNPGKDACQGDSGGPLVTETGSFYTLIGVVSWGQG